jgi:hypothetical protein
LFDHRLPHAPTVFNPSSTPLSDPSSTLGPLSNPSSTTTTGNRRAVTSLRFHAAALGCLRFVSRLAGFCDSIILFPQVLRLVSFVHSNEWPPGRLQSHSLSSACLLVCGRTCNLEMISGTATFNNFSLGRAIVRPRLSGLRSTAHIGTSFCESVRNDTKELSTAELQLPVPSGYSQTVSPSAE